MTEQCWNNHGNSEEVKSIHNLSCLLPFYHGGRREHHILHVYPSGAFKRTILILNSILSRKGAFQNEYTTLDASEINETHLTRESTEVIVPDDKYKVGSIDYNNQVWSIDH